MMRSEEDFLVVTARVGGGLDNEKPEHAGVGAARQIFPGEVMAMIPAGTCRLWREGVTPCRTPRNHRCALLHRPVDLGWYIKAVPMDDVVDIGLVADVETDLAALLQAQHRPGRSPVVAECLDHPTGRKLE